MIGHKIIWEIVIKMVGVSNQIKMKQLSGTKKLQDRIINHLLRHCVLWEFYFIFKVRKIFSLTNCSIYSNMRITSYNNTYFF